MSKVTASQLIAALQMALTAAAKIDPRAAVASAGVDILQEVFGANSEVKVLLNRIMAETAADAPEVAQAVSAYYTKRSDELRQSFKDHPGS